MRYRHLAAALLAALALGTAAPAAPILGAGPVLSAPDSVVRVGNGDGGFRQDLNRARDQRGRDGVRHSRRLERAAQTYANQLARSGSVSHTGPDGSDSWDRAQGVTCNCTAVAENLAQGPRNSDQVFRAWMRSQGHRRNMLGQTYDSYGLGRSGNTWVLMLSN